jgi:peptidyl-prolyl cis-trans isomerase SurA
MRHPILSLAAAAFLGLVAAAPLPAMAQEGAFAPVISVNGLAITGYELDQRARFIKLLGGTGDVAQLAETALIEDRLREHAAKGAGIKISAETVTSGMEEFASRANLTTDQFLQALAQGGVDPETFRSFVSAGILWREVVRARFRGKIPVPSTDVDRALSTTSGRGAGPRVLLSEIVIPVRAGNDIAAAKTADDLVKALGEGTSFADAARMHSAAPSRDAGGQVGWVPLTNLPPGVLQAVAQLRPGQTSAPLAVPGGIAIFQLRGIEQGSPEVPGGAIDVDYATLPLASAGDAAKATASRTCDALFAFARSYKGGQLTHRVEAAGAVPAGIAGALADLDENEATTVTLQGVPTVVMLCARTAFTADGSDKATGEAAEAASLAAPWSEDGPPRIEADLGFGSGPSRQGVVSEIQNQRLNQLANQYLASLKADAVIVRLP